MIKHPIACKTLVICITKNKAHKRRPIAVEDARKRAIGSLSHSSYPHYL